MDLADGTGRRAPLALATCVHCNALTGLPPPHAPIGASVPDSLGKGSCT